MNSDRWKTHHIYINSFEFHHVLRILVSRDNVDILCGYAIKIFFNNQPTSDERLLQ